MTPTADPATPDADDRSVSRPARVLRNRPDSPAILADLLGPTGLFEDGPPVAVLDVGANPLDEQAPYQVLLDADLCTVTGFEPQPDALAVLLERAGPHERYLPWVIGDGGDHTLRLCASPGFAGLLEPDPDQLRVLVDFPDLARVTAREQVTTRRLDDLPDLGRVDLVKIDIQGGELSALTGGRRVLSDAVAVQTEVGFHRLYEDQPTFADVDLELRRQGFVPHSFVATRTWPLSPVPWADRLERAARHLVEADLLYVRDLARLDLLSDGQLVRLALISDLVYGSAGVALRCIGELVGRGALDPEAESGYRALATARLKP